MPASVWQRAAAILFPIFWRSLRIPNRITAITVCRRRSHAPLLPIRSTTSNRWTILRTFRSFRCMRTGRIFRYTPARQRTAPYGFIPAHTKNAAASTECFRFSLRTRRRIRSSLWIGTAAIRSIRTLRTLIPMSRRNMRTSYPRRSTASTKPRARIISSAIRTAIRSALCRSRSAQTAIRLR